MSQVFVPLRVEHSSPEVIGLGLDANGKLVCYLGTAKGAVDGRGREDKPMFPELPADYCSVHILHLPTEDGGWQWWGRNWRVDLRAPLAPGETETYKIVVTTDTAGNVTLSWKGLQIPPGVQAKLVVPAQGSEPQQVIDLTAQESVLLTGFEPVYGTASRLVTLALNRTA